MKTIIKYSNSFGIALALCMMAISGCSCSAPKPTPDPLAGWQKDYSPPRPSDQIIEKDIQDYIQNLPPSQKGYIGTQTFYQDGTGQHAVSVPIFEGNKNASWKHVLFYDKDNKRIKVIRYDYEKYES
jgi:hypothetical protein